MQAGRLEQVGTPRDLYERPANPFVASFIGEANLLGGVATGPGVVQTYGGSVLNVPGLRAAGDLKVAIRPEKLHLVAGEVGGPNTLQGVVEQVVYVGETTRYRVRINPTESLLVKVPNRSGIETLAPGTPATVEWHQDDAVVVGL
jgi:ABC-type Fe3+/spermidine/putrescine transport system ATPase subunit